MTGFTNNSYERPWTIMVVLGALSLALPGCSAENPETELWANAAALYMEVEPIIRAGMEQRNEQILATTHRMVAEGLDGALRQYPDAPTELRELLEQMQEDEARLAAGEFSGSAARALREQHLEYWSYIIERELPPDYRQ